MAKHIYFLSLLKEVENGYLHIYRHIKKSKVYSLL